MRSLLCIILALWLAVPTPAVSVPILMYHHFTEEFTGLPDHCSAERFRTHLEGLAAAGYTSVTFADLLAYVDGRSGLPDKPVLLTSDDGYRSVVDIAWPILQEFGMQMSVAVVGSRAGKTDGIPHFSLAEAGKTALELVSHTWDLHGAAGNGVLTDQGTADPRLAADTARMRRIPELNQAVFVYPYGKWSEDSEAVLTALGYRITVTTRNGTADIRRDEPDSLRCLPRIIMGDFPLSIDISRDSCYNVSKPN
ncbi:MAG: polysaccharide deacetylase family protein [Clostridia bacterium]|nr:polysaccharide deacetylase family protein [Clostridia bacterium]